MIARKHFLLLTSTLLLSSILLTAVLLPTAATAQERDSDFPRVSPNAEVHQTIGVTDVRITYGRPSVQDREIYGGLVPYDEVWRAGANEATTITFEHDVQIEGEPLDAGTYGLFTIPGQDTWTVIFNDEPNQWGAYEYDADQDVLRVEVTPESTERTWEMMTFVFEDVSDTEGQAVLYWADTKVPVTISVDTPSLVLEGADEAVQNADSWQPPFQYAAYALQSETRLEDALDWIDRSVEMEETFYNLAVKARLLAATGNHDDAVSVGEQALAEGEAMDDMAEGVEELREEIESWRSQM